MEGIPVLDTDKPFGIILVSGYVTNCVYEFCITNLLPYLKIMFLQLKGERLSR